MPNVLKDVGTTAKYAVALVAVGLITVVTSLFVGPLALAIPAGFLGLSGYSIYKEKQEENEKKEAAKAAGNNIEKDKKSMRSDEVEMTKEEPKGIVESAKIGVKNFFSKVSSFFTFGKKQETDETKACGFNMKNDKKPVSIDEVEMTKEESKRIDNKNPSTSISISQSSVVRKINNNQNFI